jgi:hypothetical protein
MFLMEEPEMDRVHIYYCHQHAEDMRCSCCVLINSRGSENSTIRLQLLGIHINQSFMGWKKRGEYMLCIDHRHSKWRGIYNSLGSNGQAMEEMPWQPHWLFSTSEHAPTWRKRSLPWSACRRPHPLSNRDACWSKGTAIIVLTLTDMWHFPKHINALTCVVCRSRVAAFQDHWIHLLNKCLNFHRNMYTLKMRQHVTVF